MANILEVIFKGEDQVSGVVEAVKTKLTGFASSIGAAMVSASEGAEDFGTVLGATMDLASGAAGIATKVYQLGEIGAKAQDIENAFGKMAERVGLGSDMLNELKASTRGAATETQLMAVMLKALGAASDDLVSELLPAQPALMDIARALYQANPMLGSTVDIYGRLNEGIKRHQEYSIESQGIMVDYAGAANQLADSLGVERKELSDTQLSLAMLNALLASGAVLTGNVGGGVDLLSDSFGAATSAVDEATEHVAKFVAPHVARVVTGIADATILYTDAISGAAPASEIAAAAQREYLQVMTMTRRGLGGFTAETLDQARAFWKLAEMGQLSATAVDELMQSQADLSTVPKVSQWQAYLAEKYTAIASDVDVVAPIAAQQADISAQGTSAGAAYAAAFNAAVSQGIDVSGVGAGIAINVIEQLVGTDTSGMMLP